MKLKLFIPIIMLLILILLSLNVFGDVGTQYLTTGTTIYNTNDASITVYCQGIKVNTTSSYYVNVSMDLTLASGTINRSRIIITTTNTTSCLNNVLGSTDMLTNSILTGTYTYSFNTSISLTASTQYCLCVDNNGQNTASYMVIKGGGTGYADGGSSYYNGGLPTTTLPSGNDLYFILSYNINPITNYTITAQQTNGTTINNFNATITNGGTSYYGTTNGTIITDKLSNSTTLYNVTINATGYITRTYNNENASVNRLANLTRNNISLTLNYPTNNYYTNEKPITISYNITTTNPIICDLNINGLRNITNISLTTGKISNTFNLSDGLYNYSVNCSDGLNTNTTSTYNFTIDTITPIWTIRTISTSNTTKIDRETQPWIYINDTITDNNLFMYNITVYYPNNTVWFYNQTFNTTTNQFNITWNYTITSTQPNGTYKINYYAEDDHTAKTIPIYNYTKDITQSQLVFNPTQKNSLTIKLKTTDIPLTNITATKETDRYNYDYTFNGTNIINHTYVFKLTSAKQIYYRNQYIYPSFVTSDYWVDFNLNTAYPTTYSVKYVEVSQSYEITITTKETNLKFKSLGGLNIVNQTYTFEIKVNNPPLIVTTTPTQNFSTPDGTFINFTTTATDTDNDTITYTYYFDGVLNYTGQNYTNFHTPYNEHGTHTMTVYATDGGKTSNYTWNINITHSNLEAIITGMAYTPVSTWYSNLENTYITCSGYDQDNETNQTSLIYNIDYSTGGAWTALTPAYLSGETWRAYINLTTLESETLDARCRISDGEDFTSYSYLTDFITIEGAYLPPGNVTRITPNGGVRDNVIPVMCYLSNYGSVPSTNLIYKIDAYYNNNWTNLWYGVNNKALFDMVLIEYNENVSFRCGVYDGITWSNNFTTNNVTRQHETKIIMFGDGGQEVMSQNTPYTKGLYIDLYNEAGVSIIASFADCNGDGFYDYYWNYNDGRNTTKEYFTCYNRAGIILHKVGVFINKTSSTSLICGSQNTTQCKLERTYGVLIK